MTTDIMEKMAEVAPQHYAFLLKTSEEIKTSPFKEEIVEELGFLVKKAMDWRGMASGMGRGAASVGGAVGAAALGGVAMALAGDMYSAAKRGITKSRNYKQMLSANPDLKEMPAKDVQRAFSVLHRFNPEFSGDPTVSGAWVKRQVNFGEDTFGDVNQMKQLIDSHKSLSDSRKLPNVPEVKGLTARRDQGGMREPRQQGPQQGGPPPAGGPDVNKRLDEIMQRLNSEDAAGQQFFSNLKMHPAPGGGQRTTPAK